MHSFGRVFCAFHYINVETEKPQMKYSSMLWFFYYMFFIHDVRCIVYVLYHTITSSTMKSFTLLGAAARRRPCAWENSLTSPLARRPRA